MVARSVKVEIMVTSPVKVEFVDGDELLKRGNYGDKPRRVGIC